MKDQDKVVKKLNKDNNARTENNASKKKKMRKRGNVCEDVIREIRIKMSVG